MLRELPRAEVAPWPAAAAVGTEHLGYDVVVDGGSDAGGSGVLEVAFVDVVGPGDALVRAAAAELHAPDVGGVVAARGIDVVPAGRVVGVHALTEVLAARVFAVVHEVPEGREPGTGTDARGHCCGVGWGCEGMDGM